MSNDLKDLKIIKLETERRPRRLTKKERHELLVRFFLNLRWFLESESNEDLKDLIKVIDDYYELAYGED